MEKQSYTKLKMSCLQPGDFTPKEVEITLPWDAGADDCVESFVAAMRGLTYFEPTIIEAMRDYIDEIDEYNSILRRKQGDDYNGGCQKDLTVDD